MKVWPNVISNVFWAIGDGGLINFWNDVWIQQVGKLRDLYVGQVKLNTDGVVSDINNWASAGVYLEMRMQNGYAGFPWW